MVLSYVGMQWCVALVLAAALLQGCAHEEVAQDPLSTNASSPAPVRLSGGAHHDIRYPAAGQPSGAYGSGLALTNTSAGPEGTNTSITTSTTGTTTQVAGSGSGPVGTTKLATTAVVTTSPAPAADSTTAAGTSGTTAVAQSTTTPAAGITEEETTTSAAAAGTTAASATASTTLANVTMEVPTTTLSTTTTGPAEPSETSHNLTTTPTVTTTDAPVASSGRLKPVRNCYLAAPLQVGMGCTKLAEAEGSEYGLNEFGQDTTARRKCLEKTREAEGDTFVFELGRCEVWRCRSRSALRASAFPDEETAAAGAGQVVVSLLGYHDKYLAVNGEDMRVNADSDVEGPDTRFYLVHKGDGTVALHHPGTGYVSADPAGTMYGDRDRALDWESFWLEDNGDGTVSLRSFHGLYVTAMDDGSASALAAVKLDWERFRLVESATTTSAPNQEPPEPNEQAMVFSEHCEYQEATGGRSASEIRAPVFVKLWEWNYVDIARECREYLGPSGFDAVQLSPVTEHKRGSQWWTKYQPISFGLNTRSGTADEFREMVAECRAAGVEVMVDLILNHMAARCEEAWTAPPEDEAPCVGWNGSTYGNRRMTGARGWDHAPPELFRHKTGDVNSGICGVGPPSFLCGSLVTTDCSCCECDMYGLPDWNTDLQEVLEIHFKHVKELHELGVTMLRIDAALYEDIGQVSRVLNRFPWDYVEMEWWGEYPVGDHDEYIGNYRDVAMSWKITHALTGDEDLEKLPEILDLTMGTFGVENEKSVYPITVHDKRTADAVQETATYKNGLEFHQQQKFFLAYPVLERVSLWGGYGWLSLDDGPPGCSTGSELCEPTPVFGADGGAPRCLPTPSRSPLPTELANNHSWVCEHRWDGIAGLVGFRKACRGRPITRLNGTAPGQLAFRAGDECLVALVRGYNERWPPQYDRLGDWNLSGLQTGLPPGRYCNVATLSSAFGANLTQCPAEVVVGSGGVVLAGTVAEGDLLAVYGGARLPGGTSAPTAASSVEAAASVEAIEAAGFATPPDRPRRMLRAAAPR